MKNNQFYLFLITSIITILGCKKTETNTSSNIAPPNPTDLTAILVTSVKVKLDWVDKSTNEDGFKIERKTGTGNYTTIGNTGKDITTFYDSVLTLGSTYTYRVYSYNSVGPSITYTNEVSITTIGLPVLTTNAISDIMSTTAISGGTITSDGGGSITSRGVVWSTSSNPTISLSTKTTDGTGVGSFVSRITGLTTNTNYYIRSYASNSSGTSYGNELRFTTNDINLNNGLVAFYPFSGNANDLSGNNNHGTVSGAMLTTDRFGSENNAYSFNGTSDYIRISNSTSLNNNSISLSGWFFTNTLATNSHDGCKTIISKWWQTNSICNSNYDAFNIVLTKPATSCKLGTATSFYAGNVFYTPTTITTGAWFHFTFVHDSNTGGKVYINGSLVNSNTISGAICNSLNPVYIGVDNNSGFLWRYFNGKIDDLRIYNRSLSPNEISYLATH